LIFAYNVNNYVLGKFLRSDALTNFLEEVEQNRMADVHPSLNNTDKNSLLDTKGEAPEKPIGSEL